MSIEKFRKMPIIPVGTRNTPEKKAAGFTRRNIRFARRNLFCVLWGDEYVCDVPYKVRRNYLDTLVLFRIVDGGMFSNTVKNPLPPLPAMLYFSMHGSRIITGHSGPLRLQTYMITGNCSQAYFDMLYRQHGVHFFKPCQNLFFYLIIFRMRFPAIFRTITSFLFSFTIS